MPKSWIHAKKGTNVITVGTFLLASKVFAAAISLQPSEGHLPVY